MEHLLKALNTFIQKPSLTGYAIASFFGAAWFSNGVWQSSLGHPYKVTAFCMAGLALLIVLCCLMTLAYRSIRQPSLFFPEASSSTTPSQITGPSHIDASSGTQIYQDSPDS